MEYDMDIEKFSFLVEYMYKGVFLFLMEYDMDIKEFSCFQFNMVWIQWIFLVFSGI